MIHTLVLALGLRRNRLLCSSATTHSKGLKDGSEQIAKWLRKVSLVVGPKRPHIAKELDTAISLQSLSWTSSVSGRRVGVTGERNWS
jgi:hypothetical protein